MWMDLIQGQGIKDQAALIFKMHEFLLFDYPEAISVLNKRIS